MSYITTIIKEEGIIKEIKILIEQRVPGYERFIMPTMSYLRSKQCESHIRNKIGELYHKPTSLPLFTSTGLFKSIEIETINKCNGTCKFCPVNRYIDPRETVLMKEFCFYNIINQLATLNYDGQIYMQGNNEPLLDKRFEMFLKYARKNVPLARIGVYTNGSKLTIERFENIINNLDIIYLDNYSYDRHINVTTQRILDYLKNHPEHDNKVIVNVIRTNMIRTTRGGLANNRSKPFLKLTAPCIYPYTQLSIRSSGEVNLCCNDAIGKYTLGDTNTQSLVDIWYGEKYQQLRESMLNGRSNIPICSNCDMFQVDI